MANNPYDENPSCANPYYDCSANEGVGDGGGGVPPPDGAEVPTIIGTFVYISRGGRTNEELENSGYFPLISGTYSGYATKYPKATEKLPSAWVSGNDWVIPSTDGIFLRNLGGNAGSEGAYQADAFKAHSHTYTRSSFGDRFANGWEYGDYATYHPQSQNSGNTGGVETRPVNIALQLCVVVDTIGSVFVLSDTVEIASSVTVTVNGGSTEVNGKPSEVIYAGVGAYRLLIDVPQGKMIDPLGAGEWTLIDAHQGVIEFQLDRDYAEDTKDLTIEFMDLPYEGLLSKTFIYETELSFSGTSETQLFQTPNYTKRSGTKIEIDVRLPYRSNESGWGGAYTNLYYSIDNGTTWNKFLNSGYDSVMYNGTSAIESWDFSGILDFDDLVNSEQVKIKVTGTTYNNKTVYLNRYHDIKTVDTDKNYGFAQVNIKEIGTLYGVNPNYDTLPTSTLTFTAVTAENGKTTLTLLEGNIYHIKVDLEPSKRIYSVNSTNPEVKASIVDSENGFIVVDMPIGAGDSNIAVNVENKPMRTNEYALSPNPEGVASFDFCVLYNHNIGSSPIVDMGDDNFFIDSPKNIYIDGLGSPFGSNFGQGIGGSTFDFRKEKIYLNNDGWNLNKRGFVISLWVKAYESVNNMYFLGNNKAGSANQALHVGWRDLDTFTLAFWANDANWDNPNGIKRTDTIDKWFHYVMLHDTIATKSKLFINGDFVSEFNHTNGQYQSYWNMICCTTDTPRTKARFSNIRFMIGKYNVGGYLLTDAQAQNIYVQEKKVLEDLR